MSNRPFIVRVFRRIRKEFANRVLYGRFPYAYAHYYYWKCTGKELNYRTPGDFNEKMFWLARYWQDPRIIQCVDKLAVRNYIEEQGFGDILTKVYGVYDSAEEIDFSTLPEQFVLKTNNGGGGINMVLCKDKSKLDTDEARRIIQQGLNETIGIPTCEYQYQYITPKAYAEEFIGVGSQQKYEIQFFCFNGKARHILVRNDLGDASQNSFAISYDMEWNRVHDRKVEDMSISIPKPLVFDRLIEIANGLSAPFPQVRVDLYLVGDLIRFSEMTFSTSGNILWNYTDETVKKWGDELTLPAKLNTKWNKVFKSAIQG